jgi:hypothetical protein
MKFATTATVIATALALFNPAEANIRGRPMLGLDEDGGLMYDRDDTWRIIYKNNRDMDDSLGNPLRNKGNLGNLGNPRFPSWDVDDSLGNPLRNKGNLGNLGNPRFPSWDVDDSLGMPTPCTMDHLDNYVLKRAKGAKKPKKKSSRACQMNWYVRVCSFCVNDIGCFETMAGSGGGC